jgi:hypothetical protein
MPSFAVTLAHAVYAALGSYPLQGIHKLPELISEVLERPPVTIADVKAFRREYETDGAPLTHAVRLATSAATMIALTTRSRSHCYIRCMLAAPRVFDEALPGQSPGCVEILLRT